MMEKHLSAGDLRIDDAHVTSICWLTLIGISQKYPRLHTHSCVFVVSRMEVVTPEKEIQSNGRIW